jgi:hypothetical protein
MLYNTDIGIIVLILFVFLILFTYIGIQAGKARQRQKVTISEHSEIIVSILALQGLLLAFTFSVASDRFEARRTAIVAEASAIRNAILMADLYPAGERLPFRQDMRRYLEARIGIYESGRNRARTAQAVSASRRYHYALWSRMVRLSTNMAYQIPTEQMLQALSQIVDRGVIREGARRARVPDTIAVLLLVQSLATAFFVGYVNGGRRKADWLAIVLFHALVSMVIYVTLDLDRPLQGLTRLNEIHQILVNDRELFKNSE